MTLSGQARQGSVGQAMGVDLPGDAGDPPMTERTTWAHSCPRRSLRFPLDQDETRASGECLADFRVEDVGARAAIVTWSRPAVSAPTHVGSPRSSFVPR